VSYDIINKFTTHLKNALTQALSFAIENGTTEIQPEHLLIAIGYQRGCVGAEILEKLNIQTEQLRDLIQKNGVQNDNNGIDTTNPMFGGPKLSNDAKKAIEKAVLTANVYEHKYIGTEHLLSGISQIESAKVEHFLTEHKINSRELRRQISVVLRGTSRFPEIADNLDLPATDTPVVEDELLSQFDESLMSAAIEEKSKTPALDFFARDLTTKECQKNIDPVIGRANEIQRMMEILCRRTKNNPILIGEPGVGKTAIVEGLAKKILKGDVPDILANKKIFALDLAMVVAGTMYRGEFEARLKQVIDEVKNDPEIIIFVDEVHNIIGAGSSTGSMDAANILKPALARGDIHCIGATTSAEFKKHIEPDAALERRFQPVQINEPSSIKTLEILRGIKNNYEKFHQIKITDQALESAVSLSTRYIQDKYHPDKAIDLIDEAAAAKRIKRHKNKSSTKIQKIENQLTELLNKKHKAIVDEKFLDAIDLKKQEQTLKTEYQKLISTQENKSFLGTIDVADIAAVVSRTKKIPLKNLLKEERLRLLNLEKQLASYVLGQKETIKKVSNFIRRAKTGISDPARPLASFLFLGPSGVGKTELAKVLSHTLFEEDDSIIRLDMSEFAESFTASKLIGSPAGYVGYRDSTKLSDKVKQRPYSVVLFDEVEKAHKDITNLLLQILEEGEISDATGRKINFKNTIIILTSNIGIERFTSGNIGFYDNDASKRKIIEANIMKDLEEHFQPELLNRLDEICIFNPLEKKVVNAITKLQLEGLQERLLNQSIICELDKSVIRHVSQKSYNPKYGAREIRRVIQENIESKIAEHILKSGKSSDSRLVISVKNKQVNIESDT